MFTQVDSAELGKLRQAIDGAKNILITSHHRPDGDAVGSTLALMHYLKRIGKKCTALVPSEFPGFLAWMKDSEQILIYENDKQAGDVLLKESDLIFCLDYNDAGRVHDMKEGLLNATGVKVLIDHHLEPSDFCDIIFSYTNACSTAEIIYRVISALDPNTPLSKEISEAIYTGIMTDTGSFRYASMTAVTHEVIAALIRNGVLNYKIHENVFNDYSEDRTRLMGFVVTERMKVLHEYHTAYMWLTIKDLERFNYQSGDTEGLVNIALAIKGMKVAALFTESNGIIKISLRSVGKISVQQLSTKYFYGGGHMNAAGGKSDLNMEKTLERFEEILAENKKIFTT